MSRGTSGSSDAFANVVQADAPPLPPVFPVMVRVSENVHPRGLDFSNQRKVVVLRDVYSKSFVDIAQEVRNVAGGRPSPRTCCQYYQRFSTVAGWKKSQYHQCGRRAWKLTADVRRFLLQRLKKLRQEGLCTCKLLQTELARQKGICVEVSTVQKFLKSQGYKWLPRAQKRRYTAVHMRERKAFAHAVLSLGVRRFKEAVLLHGRMCFATPTERPHRQAQLSSGLGHPHVAPEIGKVGSIIGWPGHLLQAEPTGPLRSSLGWPQRRRFFHSDISPEKEIDQG